MSDEVKAEPAWKTDPALAHFPITDQGVARWRGGRLEELDAKGRQGDAGEVCGAAQETWAVVIVRLVLDASAIF